MSNILFFIGIISASIIYLIVLYMIRTRKLIDEYAFLWLIFATIFLLGAVFSDRLLYIYKIIKGGSGASEGMLIFMALLLIILVIILLSSKISVHQEQIKNLTQKIGLLDNSLRNIKRNDDKKNIGSKNR